MIIKVNTGGEALASLDSLEPFQGELKKLSDENFNKLRGKILASGFNFTPSIWKQGDKQWILDGHQRIHVLKQLVKQGYDLERKGILLNGQIPVCYVDAHSFEEAKDMVLQAVSQYGKIDRDGFLDFTEELDIDMEQFDFPDFQLPSTDIPNFEPGDENEQGKLDKLKTKTCPECGCEF